MSLTAHLAANPGLSFRARSNGQYVVGGYWRRRPDIAAVVEIDSGPFRRPLVERVVHAARQLGCQLVIAELRIPTREIAGWGDVGFGPIDTIVEYEKPDTAYDPRVVDHDTRLAEPEDVRPIVALEQLCFPWLWRNSPAELLHYRESPDSELWLAPGVDGPVGYVGLTVRGDRGHLDRLAVDPRARRRGIGSVLVARALDRLQARGVRRVTLTTQYDNTRAQPLYRRFGFHATGGQLTIHARWLGRPRDRTP